MLFHPVNPEGFVRTLASRVSRTCSSTVPAATAAATQLRPSTFRTTCVPCTMDERISRVIKTRIDRILLVLENVTDNRNYLAALRTCDVLGVQRVWVIHSADKKTVDPSQLAVAAAATAAGETDTPVQTEEGRKKNRIARAASAWLDVRHFGSTAAAVQALRSEGWTLWATDLSPGSVSLVQPGLQLPERLAIVLGSESRGISSDMRAAADRCVHLPMYGFTESLNVGVASGLVLQALIAADPSIRGQLLGEGRAHQLADKWRAAVANRRQEPSELQSLMQFVREDSQQQQQQQQQQLPGPDLGSSFSQLQPHPQQQPHIS